MNATHGENAPGKKKGPPPAPKPSELSGQDLVYWVARANNPDDQNVVRKHYGDSSATMSFHEESARLFVERKFGAILPNQEDWQ